jgi:hypothetical protein
MLAASAGWMMFALLVAGAVTERVWARWQLRKRHSDVRVTGLGIGLQTSA